MHISKYKIILNCFILFSLDYNQRSIRWPDMPKIYLCTWHRLTEGYEHVSYMDIEDLDMYEENIQDNFNEAERMKIKRLFNS